LVAIDVGWSRSGSSAAPAHTAANVTIVPALGSIPASAGA
jgi:hypothetical protein